MLLNDRNKIMKLLLLMHSMVNIGYELTVFISCIFLNHAIFNDTTMILKICITQIITIIVINKAD